MTDIEKQVKVSKGKQPRNSIELRVMDKLEKTDNWQKGCMLLTRSLEDGEILYSMISHAIQETIKLKDEEWYKKYKEIVDYWSSNFHRKVYELKKEQKKLSKAIELVKELPVYQTRELGHAIVRVTDVLLRRDVIKKLKEMKRGDYEKTFNM